MGKLDFPQAVEEIKQAAKWLREQGAPKVPLTVLLLHHERPPFSLVTPSATPLSHSVAYACTLQTCTSSNRHSMSARQPCSVKLFDEL